MQTEIKSPSGKMYNLAPLTIEDIVDLKAYCQYQPWHQLNGCKDQFPEGYAEKHLDKIFDDCTKRVVNEGEIDKYLGTIDGAREIIHLSLRHNHDGITKQEAGSVLSIGNFNDAVKRLLSISGMWTEDAKPNPPKRAKKRSP